VLYVRCRRLRSAFLYSQARILAANKGIPAWRHPASVPLDGATGLAEGAGFVVSVPRPGRAGRSSIAAVLLILVAVRAWCWRATLPA
jgi:phenylacetyl-CoA:acceptor oxidoreductase subunit 2